MLLTPNLYNNGILNKNLSILEIFTKSVDSDEMPVNAIESHQNLACLL